MGKQLGLFGEESMGSLGAYPGAERLATADRPLPHNGTPTSRAAAEGARPAAGSRRLQVLEAVKARGDDGATAEELERALGLSGNTIRPRLVELRAAGLVRVTTRMRPTINGYDAAVYVAV
jgi:DNA-binding transcriptional ArsR family regulator